MYGGRPVHRGSAGEDCIESCPCRVIPLRLSVFSAASLGEVSSLAARLKEKPSNASLADTHGYTALHHGARQGRLGIINLLLKYDINIDANLCGVTPLHLAAVGGHSDCVKALLDAGASINALDTRTFETPLHKAASAAHVKTYSLLSSNGADLTLLDSYGQTASEILTKALEEADFNANNPTSTSSICQFLPQSTSQPSVSTIPTENNIERTLTLETTTTKQLVCSACQQPAVVFSKSRSGRLLCSTCKQRSPFLALT